MPKFSQKSFSQLATCHQELQLLFYEVIRTWDCTVLEGYRNEHDQQVAYLAGNSKLTYPHGKHNKQPSMAVDVAPYPLNWDDTKRFCYFAGYVLGVASRLRDEGKMTYGVRWGGDWNNEGELNNPDMLNDYVHYELV